jgi:hypothetical protein
MKQYCKGKIIDIPIDEEFEIITQKLLEEDEYASKQYIRDRISAYGSVEKQIEYLVEHGIEAFVQRQLDIKAQYPKPE